MPERSAAISVEPMRILVLTDKLPSPALGDGLRVLGLLNPLHRKHRLELLAFARPGEVLDPRIDALFATVDVLSYPEPTSRSTIQSTLRSLAARNFKPHSEAMRAEVRQRLASGRYDLVLDIAANMLVNLPHPLPVPLAVDLIDEPLLRDFRAIRSLDWHGMPRLLYNVSMFWRYERAFLRGATVNIFASEVDAEVHRRAFPGRRVAVVPNGVDTTFFAPLDLPPDPTTVVFEGNLMFEPNVDAARRLVKDILPRLVELVPEARVVLLGRDPAAEVRALASDRVQVTGTVADIRPDLARATVVACPMHLGSGIKNKILQAWSMARPVVASSRSIGGLNVAIGENILIRDDPTTFAEAIAALMRDTVAAARLGAAGRATVEREYRWEQRAAQFEALLALACRSTAPQP